MPDPFVQQLRANMTDAEHVLWRQLRAHRLCGHKFRRQQRIGPYIADFVHFGSRLIVEADGGQPNESVQDAHRDAWFREQGFRVLRFWNNEILTETQAVLERILAAVDPARLSPSAVDSPHGPLRGDDNPPTLPNPSRASGEGLHVASASFGASVGRALLPLPAAPIVVGYSGGLDSSVLLHALAALPAARASGLRAIHVHHGLHAEADAWAAHCASICTAIDVPLTTLRVQVDTTSGRGPENAARAARLSAFRDALGDDELLALAHHCEDQAETVLLRLLRGAGGDGLAAMRRRSRLGSLSLWRPLLELPRTALREYANAHGLRWIEDPSNDATDFDRNFLRHRVLPTLTQRWPQAARNLARSAALLAEQSRLLAAVSTAQLDGVQVAADTLSIPRLLVHSRAQRARILRVWLRRLLDDPPPASVLAAIERNLLCARHDRSAQVDWAGIVLQRWCDRLHARRPMPPLPREWSATWDGRAPLRLPDGSRLELLGATGFDARLHVRDRRGGERIRLPGRAHHHTLKHVLQDRRIPPWARLRLPLLFGVDGELLSAGDAIVSDRMAAWLRERGAWLCWSTPSE